MKIIEVKTIAFPEIKLIRYERFADTRGYFTETFRESDLLKIIPEFNIKQVNESYSVGKVLRGLHLQWNPYMGKLVRVINGEIIDLFCDLRKNSPTFGKIAGYRLTAKTLDGTNFWIWVPVGFAHGFATLEKSTVEYLCTGEYSPGCEACISPVSADLDWSLCDQNLKTEFDRLKKQGLTISDKDKQGLSIEKWSKDERLNNFIYK